MGVSAGVAAEFLVRPPVSDLFATLKAGWSRPFILLIHHTVVSSGANFKKHFGTSNSTDKVFTFLYVIFSFSLDSADDKIYFYFIRKTT